MANAIDRLRSKLSQAQESFAARGGLANGPKRKRRRQHTRQVVKVSRLDSVEWGGNLDEQDSLYLFDAIAGVRNDPEVDKAISDLFYGDPKSQADRPGYLNAPELLQDIFFIFYKAQPILYKKFEVVKDARLNGKFIEQVMALPAYEEVHDYTITDPETAKDAMLAFVEVIKELIRQHRDAVHEANEQREADGCDPLGPPGNSNNAESWDEETPQPKAGRGKSEGADRQDGKSQFDSDENDDDQEDQPAVDWDYHELDDDHSGSQPGGGEEVEGDDQDPEAQIDEAAREFDEDYLDQDYETESDWNKLLEGVDIGRLANSALRQAAAELANLKEARHGVGIDDAEWKMMDPHDRLRIAKELNTPRMKAIADMVGRMRRFAMSQQAQKVIDAPHEIFTLEQGSDLRRVVRSEFAFLGRPETRIWFFYKFINGELLQFKERGHEDVGKGPIICCIDNSGSMSGEPENWAKGVAEALRRICQDQGRDFHVIYFETNRHRERFDFPKGRGPFEKVMAFLGISAGGGTEFDGVLTEALQKAQAFFEGKPEYGKSDIVFITDGAARLDAKWIGKFNDERHKAGVRVFSIYISAYDSDRGSAMGLLKQFSDVAVPVKALQVNDDTTAELFATI